MKPTVFLDMDGVIVDFVAGACKLHGKENKHDIGYTFWSDWGITDDEFWLKMDFDFWANLPWTAEGQEFLGGIERMVGNHVVLMTSPCVTVGSVEGKVDWIRRNLPRYARQFFVGPAKWLAAAPNKILVDDYAVNVDLFEAHGGMGLLVPRPWNRLADQTTDGKFHVNNALNRLEERIAIINNL